MEQTEVEKLIGELETALDRLRSLYEQYFVGIERIEPGVARKDVERRLYVLRREQIRNTALRYRFQMVLQRFNTYQTHWLRICREIENGTYKRHLLRAQRRFGSSRPPRGRTSVPPPAVHPEAEAPLGNDVADEAAPLARIDPELSPDSFEVDVSLDDGPSSGPAALYPAALPAAIPAAILSVAESTSILPRPGAGAPRAGIPAASPPVWKKVGAPAAPAAPRPAPPAVAAGPAPAAPAVGAAGTRPVAAPPAAAGAAPGPPAAGAVGARPWVAPPVATGAAPGPPAAGAVAARPAVAPTVTGARPPPAPPAPGARVAPDAAPAARPAPAPPAPAARPGPDAAPAARPAPDAAPAARPAPAPPAPAAPPAPIPAAPAARPASPSPQTTAPTPPPAAPSRAAALPVPPLAIPPRPLPPRPSPSVAPRPPAADSSDLSEKRLRQIYVEYVDTKRRQNESTATLTYQSVAKSLRESEDRLRQKHGKPVDFEVGLKDGKTVLRPVLK